MIHHLGQVRIFLDSITFFYLDFQIAICKGYSMIVFVCSWYFLVVQRFWKMGRPSMITIQGYKKNRRGFFITWYHWKRGKSRDDPMTKWKYEGRFTTSSREEKKAADPQWRWVFWCATQLARAKNVQVQKEYLEYTIVSNEYHLEVVIWMQRMMKWLMRLRSILVPLEYSVIEIILFNSKFSKYFFCCVSQSYGHIFFGCVLSFVWEFKFQFASNLLC